MSHRNRFGKRAVSHMTSSGIFVEKKLQANIFEIESSPAVLPVQNENFIKRVLGWLWDILRKLVK